MPRRSKKPEELDQATKSFEAGYTMLHEHPMFRPMLMHGMIRRGDGGHCPPNGWAVVTRSGSIHVHPTRRAEPDEWVYLLAHCLLHLGLGHLQARQPFREWNTACDCVVARFLATFKLGRPPQDLHALPDLPTQSEENLFARFVAEGIPPEWRVLGTAGPDAPDMRVEPQPEGFTWRKTTDWQRLLGHGLAMAVSSAVNVAAGQESRLGADAPERSNAQRAREWFISSFPLLGALAASFRVVEDAPLCIRLQVSVAAVDAEMQEIYMNPAAGLDERECRFVMAHELLHVGLRHAQRRQGRDAFLWNVACDYVINAWLVEMGLGAIPQLGALYDPALARESAESLYDRIVADMRRYRKLATLRGVGLGDIIERRPPGWWQSADGLSLDDFYRRCLGQGLEYHEAHGRGLLPGDLVEEIRALAQPPIPWDVQLAQWFDEHFPPVEKVRSYARPSRRQWATPAIPRPRWTPREHVERGRTFGVVLDTSGSMDRGTLARALGAIGEYSLARDVHAVRVVFCDAITYDQGYMSPEEIGGRVKVRGRGGTILQPGIDLLETAQDFPRDGPMLIITDGQCDRLHVGREHAYLLPRGRHLPFVPRGKTFFIE